MPSLGGMILFGVATPALAVTGFTALVLWLAATLRGSRGLTDADLVIVLAAGIAAAIVRGAMNVAFYRSFARATARGAVSVTTAPLVRVDGDAVPFGHDRKRVSSGSPYEAKIGFSRAVRVGSLIAVSGTAPIWPDGSVDPDPEVQARRCLEIILAALAEAGGDAEDVVGTRTYLVDRADADAVARAHSDVFREIRPTSTMVVVSGFLDPRWRVEMEAEAVVSRFSEV